MYPPVIKTALGVFKALNIKFRIEGTENIPGTGGAVLVSNHVSYLDFIFAGYGAHPSGRLTRFMAKHEIFAAVMAEVVGEITGVQAPSAEAERPIRFAHAQHVHV